jgi:hypothetical protein
VTIGVATAISERKHHAPAALTICICWLWVLVSSCATSEPKAASHFASPADVSTQAPRKLPRTSHIDISNDTYPDEAKLQGLTAPGVASAIASSCTVR